MKGQKLNMAQLVEGAIKRRKIHLQDPKSQAQITKECGLKSHNMLAMVKRGTSKMPAGLILPFCKACDEDPEPFVLAYFDEYMPELIPLLDAVNIRL